MSQRNSCLIKLENDSFVAIRRSNLILCNENECAAALINYYEFRHNCKLSELDEKVSNNRNYKVGDRDYLIQASNQYLAGALLYQFSRNKIIEANAVLMKLGYIKIITDVFNPNGGKPVNHILFNAEFINQRLKQDVANKLKQDVNNVPNRTLQRLKQDVATSQTGRIKDILIDSIKDTTTTSFEADANLKNQNTKSDPDGIVDNVPPVESEFKEAKKEPKVVSKKRGQAKIVSGEKSAEKEHPKTSMLSHAVDFNKIEFSKTAEILFSFNDSKFRQSQIRLGNVTNENFKDAVEAFLIQTTATEPIKHITVKDLANHFANWCNTVQKDKIEQKIKALKKTTDVTADKLSAQDEFKAIQADLIQKIAKGELSERKALEIAANKKKELGIQ
jgi:hypothetical protein